MQQLKWWSLQNSPSYGTDRVNPTSVELTLLSGWRIWLGIQPTLVWHRWQEIANHREFLKWTKKFVYQAHILCEVLRLVPSPLKPYINTLFSLQKFALVLILLQCFDFLNQGPRHSSKDRISFDLKRGSTSARKQGSGRDENWWNCLLAFLNLNSC